MGAQRCGQLVEKGQVCCRIQAIALLQQAAADHQAFHFLVTLVGQFHLATFLVDQKVAVDLIVAFYAAFDHGFFRRLVGFLQQGH